MRKRQRFQRNVRYGRQVSCWLAYFNSFRNFFYFDFEKHFVMKNILIITLAIIFTSCNPFISKDLRRKNKCNRKVERELNRHKKKVAKIAVNCPEIIKENIAVKVYDTTIITINSKIDTVVSFDFDTITLFKDKLRLKLIRTRDTLIIDGECLPDTIRIIERIEIPYSSNSKIKLNIFEKTMNAIKPFFWWILGLIALFVAYRVFIKK